MVSFQKPKQNDCYKREPEKGWSVKYVVKVFRRIFGQSLRMVLRLRLNSDGSALLLRMIATPPASRQVVQYLNGICELVPLAAFEATVLSFAEAVIDRMHSMGCRTSLLQDLRENIVEERSNPSSVRWREMEAIIGL